jgi:putative copper resistance protein D
VIETAVVAARIVQFLAATVLFGTPLFFLYALKGSVGASMRWPRPLLRACAGGVIVGAFVSLFAQTAVMAGDPAAAFDPDTLVSVLTGTAFGLSIAVRVAAAAAALAAAWTMPSRSPPWLAFGVLGAVVLASFAWSGHGAAEDGAAGRLHAAADVLHLLAAGVWLGALAALAILLAKAKQGTDPAASEALHGALATFSGIGSGVVAVILATGLINSWFLVGPAHIGRMPESLYGRLLLLKIGLFAAMLGLAALNRYRLTPALAAGLAQGDSSRAIAALRRSVVAETVAGFGVLVVVGLLGTLQPIAAQ